MIETSNPIKWGGSFLDDVIAQLICKRQVGFHEVSFILSQKAKDPTSAVSEVKRSTPPLKEKQNTEPKWESCRRRD